MGQSYKVYPEFYLLFEETKLFQTCWKQNSTEGILKILLTLLDDSWIGQRPIQQTEGSSKEPCQMKDLYAEGMGWRSYFQGVDYLWQGHLPLGDCWSRSSRLPH